MRLKLKFQAVIDSGARSQLTAFAFGDCGKGLVAIPFPFITNLVNVSSTKLKIQEFININRFLYL